MKKGFLSIIVKILSGIFLIFPYSASAEVIRNFTTEIGVFPDSSLVVEERIIYDFEKSLRHGINRDIVLSNNDGKLIEVEVISVTDADKNPFKFTTSTKENVLNIKIGDPGVIISGEKTYHIIYRVSGGVSYYEGFDEIYWNVTGNNWNVPIITSEVKVNLPKGVFPKDKKCFYGPVGSKSECRKLDENSFVVDSSLNKGEGMTVAVSFEKGSVLSYSNKFNNKFFIFLKTFWPIFIPILAFGMMFYRWYKKGRDPKGRGIIKPEYEAPKDLSPIEVSGIVNESIRVKSISAQIIDLAIRGYIKIKPIEEKAFGFKYKQDYELTLLEEIGYLNNAFDKEIILTIFGDNPTVGGVTMLSALDNLFYKSVPRISGHVIDSLLKKKYYFNFPKNIIGETLIIVSSVLLIFFSGGYLVWSSVDFQDPKKLAIFFTSLIVSISSVVAFNLLMPSKTTKGVLMKEYLLGLREYLQIAEKDRLAFHNAPEKKPEIFEKLLPYAIVFGVEDAWAKEFEGIYTKAPSWYEGGQACFSASVFGKEISRLDTVFSSSISSSPSSSGVVSGSSGGGFGGGGGGSW